MNVIFHFEVKIWGPSREGLATRDSSYPQKSIKATCNTKPFVNSEGLVSRRTVRDCEILWRFLISMRSPNYKLI